MPPHPPSYAMSTTSPETYARALLQDPLIGSFISLMWVYFRAKYHYQTRIQSCARLYGASCVQTFFYFQTYQDDHIWLKCLVWPFNLHKLPTTCQWNMMPLCCLGGASLVFSHYNFDHAITSYFPCPRILESVHSGFTIAFNTKYLINGFGNLLALDHIAWCVY